MLVRVPRRGRPGQVVKEYPANAARLGAVLDVKVLVAPFLEFCIVGRVVCVAHLLDRAVKVGAVLGEYV